MYEHEHVEFGMLLRDLCISTDRPFDKDLLRVFLNDLKDVPFQAIQRQAAILTRKGDKRFKSADLRPPAEEGGGLLAGFDNHAIVDKITQHMLRHVWPHLSQFQRLFKHSWVYTRDRAAPRCVALKIEPDTVEVMINGELQTKHYPGHYIRHEDCDAFYEPSRDNMPLQSRDGENFNEADAARDLLSRKS